VRPEKGEDGGFITNPDDNHRQGKHGQWWQRVTDVKNLHHVFGDTARSRAAKRNSAGNTDQQRKEHGAEHQNKVLLPEIDQIHLAGSDCIQTNTPTRSASTTAIAAVNSKRVRVRKCALQCVSLCACVMATEGCVLLCHVRQGI
jgi:hypothetical protein